MALVLVEGEEEISSILGTSNASTTAQALTTSTVTVSNSPRQTGNGAYRRAAVASILVFVVMFTVFP
jgi:hypothetical protein